MIYDDFKREKLGKTDNIDGAEGPQCVDVPKSYAERLFPGVPWRISIGYGNAKDMFANANANYFDKIWNDHNNPNQLPSKGDIVVFAASPEPGYTSTFGNPYGHCAIVDQATPSGLVLLQQDGSTGQATVQLKNRAWRYTRCIGWLHPKIGEQPQPQSNEVPIRINNGNWNVRTSPEMANNIRQDGHAVGGQTYGAVIDGNGWAKISFMGGTGHIGPKAYQRI